MILQSLYNYYQILLHEGGIAAPGYTNELVSHAINLSTQGELLDIIPLYVPVQMGKKTVERPRRMNIPARVKRSGNIAANFLSDNAAYVLGLSDKDAKDPDYAQKRFEDFRKLNIEILSQVDSPIARAVIAFLLNYDPIEAMNNPIISRHLDELLQGRNLIFQVEGENVLDDPKIRKTWEQYVLGQEAIEMQCLVTGGIEPIERLHPDIKGVPGAQTKGASLVSFNLDAFKSYGREQGVNAPISRRAASGYTTALNYLLSDQNPNRKIFLGDTTIVYWADSEDKRYASAFYSFLNPDFLEEETNDLDQLPKRIHDKNAEQEMSEEAKKIEQVKPVDLSYLRNGLDESTRFYVLGLAPNAARLAIRYFMTESFGVFAERIMQHYDDMKIEKEFPNQPTYLSPYRILAECVSPKVNRRDEEVKASWSLLGGALMRSILTGSPYPEGLYTAMINRIRHDSDEMSDQGHKRNVKINYIRAAYIKAHLLRKFRYQGSNPYQEVLQMSLNDSFSHPAYVLGRLFAVLEKAQLEAQGGKLNATIKDRYFTTACASPASVFPILLRLSQHHIEKAEYGYVLDRQIQELVDMLAAKPFPAHLSLDEQGLFILGYYHQKVAFYNKKELPVPLDDNQVL